MASNRLDLTDNTHLLLTPGGLLLVDPRGAHRSNTGVTLLHDDDEPGAEEAAVLAVFGAGRRGGDGALLPVVSLDLEDPNEIYAGKVLEGTARYGDGAREFWRVRIDPSQMRFQWVRQPEQAAEPLVFAVTAPRRVDTLDLWHTGMGRQIDGRGADAAAAAELDSDGECELLFYGAYKNCLRLELSGAGRVRVRRAAGAQAALGGDAAWSANDAAGPAPLWSAEWDTPASGMVQLFASCGVMPAARHFDGRQRLYASNASMDFGPFYAAMALGALPLNLRRETPEGPLGAAAGVLQQRPAAAALRDVTWAGELLYLLDPLVVGQLLGDTLDAHLAALAGGAPPRDEDAALLLMLAGRYHTLSGDTARIAGHLPGLRRLGLHVLGLRAAGEALPTVRETWELHGPVTGKEPYFTAIAMAGLQRLAVLEELAGDPAQAAQWHKPASAMRRAALDPWDDGGLWNPDRGAFVSRVAMRRGLPLADTSYSLYQNVIPFWLGLVEDEEIVWRAYDGLDDQYTYTSNRGGVTVPPGAGRSFVALLDVCVRHRYGVPGADNLLGFALAHAMDAGLPMTAAPFGVYGQGVAAPGIAPGDAGMLLDNSPYFTLVLGQHYGLDYDHRGWRIGPPSPLRDYPLSRVTNLRHRHALYAITWQKLSRGRRILLDGKPLQGNLLAHDNGDHEVIVELNR